MASVPVPQPFALPKPVAAAPKAASAPSNNGTFWVGSNGLVYVSGGNGVNSAGKADGNTNSYWSSRGFKQIADPNPPKASAVSSNNVAAPSNPNGVSGGGGSASTYQDKSNDIALNNAGLASLDSQSAAGMDAISKALASIFGQYDTEKTSNETNYTDQSDTNQNNLQKNKQATYVNAASGRQGLFGKLASIGALNGDGIKLATNAVRNGANDDLSGANDTFEDNQTTLDAGINAFRTADDKRRKDASTAAEDAKTNVTNKIATSRQNFLQNLSNDFAAQGDSARARSYADQAGSLFDTIAKTTIPSTNLGYTGAGYTPGTLSSYLAGNTSTAVNSTPAQGTGGGLSLPGLYVGTKKKTATTV